jgi:hypothetical protein
MNYDNRLTEKRPADNIRVYHFSSTYNQNCSYNRSRDSAVGIATGYGLDDRGSEFESR